MNLKELKEILALFEGAEITEMDLEREGVRLRLRKGEPPMISGVASAMPIMMHGAAAAPQAPPALAQTAVGPAQEPRGEEITAPMVGTFYRAPSPDADPYVEAGTVCESDSIVCIIEAMKLMNEIKAERRCKIVKVLVENGHPVEYGQPLFEIEPL